MKNKASWRWVLPNLAIGLLGTACSRSSGTEIQAGTELVQAQILEQGADEAMSEEDDGEMDLELMMDMRPMRALTRDGSMYVRSETPNLPRVRFPDGQVGASDSCAVRMGNKLNRQVPPAYVNGQPVGFC